MASTGKVVVYATNKDAVRVRAQVQQRWEEAGIDIRNPKYFDARFGAELQGKSKERLLAVVVVGHWPAIVAACSGQGVEVEEWSGTGEPPAAKGKTMHVHIWGNLKEVVGGGALWGDLAAAKARSTFKQCSLTAREPAAFSFEAKSQALELSEQAQLGGAVVAEGLGEISAFYQRLGVEVVVLNHDSAGAEAETLPLLDNPGTQGVIAAFLKAGQVEFQVLIDLQDNVQFLLACAVCESQGENRPEYHRLLDTRLRALRHYNPYMEHAGISEAEREAARQNELGLPKTAVAPKPEATTKKPALDLETASLRDVGAALNLEPTHTDAEKWVLHILMFPAKEVIAEALAEVNNPLAFEALLKYEQGKAGKKRTGLLKTLQALISQT